MTSITAADNQPRYVADNCNVPIDRSGQTAALRAVLRTGRGAASVRG